MKLKLLFVFVALFICSTAGAWAAPICPVTGSTNTDCGYIITIGPGGVITGSAVAGANPYDGSDDALIGVVNNSGAVYTGSFTLTGSGNGGGIFGFDGDGICAYVNAPYCATAASGYEGPLNTFSGINGNGTTGTVNITNLGIGANTFFSLEGSPSSISGGIVVGNPVPEPGSLMLLATGLVGAAGSIRRRLRV
jgi:hypothetical protein